MQNFLFIGSKKKKEKRSNEQIRRTVKAFILNAARDHIMNKIPSTNPTTATSLAFRFVSCVAPLDCNSGLPRLVGEADRFASSSATPTVGRTTARLVMVLLEPSGRVVVIRIKLDTGAPSGV